MPKNTILRDDNPQYKLQYVQPYSAMNTQMNSITLLATLFMLVSSSKTENTEINATFLKCFIPRKLELKLHKDCDSIERASTDWGNMVHNPPMAVFTPSSVEEILTLVRSSHSCSRPFPISARGNGHSTQGQSTATNGVVIDMSQMRKISFNILIAKDLSYADVGGWMLWRDVLNQTYPKGLLPVCWTDYLDLTVGGTLSSSGISGSTFRVGPQINNVLELDIVTGEGKLLTCSPSQNPELFYSVLGGRGQFGIITRARIPLQRAKQEVRWVHMIYSEFEDFKEDQEKLIEIYGKNDSEAGGFLYGDILLDNGSPNSWSTSFYASDDLPKIRSLISKLGVIYTIEFVVPYNYETKCAVVYKMDRVIEELSPITGMVYRKDAPMMEYLLRVQPERVEAKGSHPFLGLLVPKSHISDFQSGVIQNMLAARKNARGPLLIYPVFKDKWDARMSVPTPDEDIFFVVTLLIRSNPSDGKPCEDDNEEILEFCKEKGIQAKTYLHRYSTEHEWMSYYGSKWPKFLEMKDKFDPKHILAPGQRIFDDD